MGIPAKKQSDQQPDEQVSEVVDLSNERELRLAKNFDDPGLEEILPGPTLVEETAEAVQELVLDPSIVFAVDGHSAESSHESARWDMAEKLFQLVVCDRSFNDLVESALGFVMASIDGQAGSVLEFDYDHKDYFFRASVGGASPPEKLKAFRVPDGKGIVGHVAESRQSILLRDLEEDQMQMRAISMSVGFEAKTCIAVPVIVGNQLYGVIEVFNKKDGSFFEEKDLSIFEAGVRMLAKVLEVRFLMAELNIGRASGAPSRRKS